MEINLEDGSISTDPISVLNKWKNDFSSMLNVENCIQPSENVDSKDQDKCDYLLDCEITIRLFNVCYNTGKVPVLWAKGVIVPVPKCSSSDPRDPLSYRGITLAPATYKLYCGVLDCRLREKFDASDIIHDEQNGFRKDRNTIDHLLSITSIIESRKLRKQSTYAAFIDFKKAYDTINRALLFSKLELLGVSSKMIKALRSLYNNVQSCIKLNGLLSDWFPVNTGLKQGCIISPLLFNFFINDLIDEVKKLNVGISIGEEKVCIMLYADDVVFLTESESELQIILNTLEYKLGLSENRSAKPRFS
ncbi:unnamed protein product [Mytilus edulis]|uniref:Reverse transcriptase domain-containing protein n=1 Tax=Mytilus edulis TaxID=6550 RepID=A0A8S3QI79_MYTED|nr:unnamed protein product [Mytilus edulis]